MTTNLEELKTISRSALIQELTEKSKRCGLTWHVDGAGRFRAAQGAYTFVLSKTSADITNLDVQKAGTLYRSYNSSTQSEVADLYETVANLPAASDAAEKYKTIGKFMGTLRTCRDPVVAVSTSGGVLVAGAAGVTATEPFPETILSPDTLTFDPTPFPWSGVVASINDAGLVTSHDGDSSYIRQEVAGELPTQWGFATVDFAAGLPFIGDAPPFQLNARVAHRREALDGVVLYIDVIVNNAVEFHDEVVCDETYSIYQSGYFTLVATEIDSLQIRLSIFTNTGDPDPRAIRISAVDVGVKSYQTL